MLEPGVMVRLDMNELAARLAEVFMGLPPRPPEVTGAEVMAIIRAEEPDDAAIFMRAASGATDYIAECCNSARPGTVTIMQEPRAGARVM